MVRVTQDNTEKLLGSDHVVLGRAEQFDGRPHLVSGGLRHVPPETVVVLPVNNREMQ